jgi:xanthine/uracil/vitamin C permease (AzgA family)
MEGLYMRRISLAAALLVVAAPGCSRWGITSVAPRAAVQDSRPKAVRVTTFTGSSVILAEPSVRGDSLVGLLRHNGNRATAVSLGDVASLETRRFDVPGTMALIAVGGAAAFGLVYLAVLFTYSPTQ